MGGGGGGGLFAGRGKLNIHAGYYVIQNLSFRSIRSMQDHATQRIGAVLVHQLISDYLQLPSQRMKHA